MRWVSSAMMTRLAAVLALGILGNSVAAQDLVALSGLIGRACQNQLLANSQLTAMNEFMGVAAPQVCGCYGRLLAGAFSPSEASAFMLRGRFPDRLAAFSGDTIKYCA